MRRPAKALSTATVVLVGFGTALGVSGCGGETVSADEVKAAPPELSVPGGADAGAALVAPGGSGNASKRGKADPSAAKDSKDSTSGASDPSSGGSSSSSTGAAGSSTPSPGSSSPPSTAPSTGSETQGAGTPNGASTGGSQAAPDPTSAPKPDSAKNDSAPPAGSGAAQFEQFCQDNPGAC